VDASVAKAEGVAAVTSDGGADGGCGGECVGGGGSSPPPLPLQWTRGQKRSETPKDASQGGERPERLELT